MRILKKTGMILLITAICWLVVTFLFSGKKVGITSENEERMASETDWQSGSQEAAPQDDTEESVSENTENTEAESLSSVESEAESSAQEQTEESAKKDGSEESEPEEEKPSLYKLLSTGRLPIGHTLYIWGGGWNEEDTGAGEEAVTLGESPRWAEFCSSQDATYNFDNTRYQIHDGLDCSGYIGWVVYNTLETENGREGYVDNAAKLAGNYTSKGLGQFIPNSEQMTYEPGDVVCTYDHVVLVVGQCEDGSILFMHASPPGVSLTGTMMWSGEESQASLLAKEYMMKYYPDWVSYYTTTSKPGSYLSNGAIFRWSEDVLADPEGIRKMTPEQILALVFKDAEPTDRAGKTIH